MGVSNTFTMLGYTCIFIVCQKSVLYLVLYEHDYNDRSARTHTHTQTLYVTTQNNCHENFKLDKGSFISMRHIVDQVNSLQYYSQHFVQSRRQSLSFFMMVTGKTYFTGKTRMRKSTLSCAVSRLKNICSVSILSRIGIDKLSMHSMLL